MYASQMHGSRTYGVLCQKETCTRGLCRTNKTCDVEHEANWAEPITATLQRNQHSVARARYRSEPIADYTQPLAT
jgi:hypothetical protein